MTATKVICGRSPGMLTCQCFCHELQPSIWAASYSSSGMFCSPARKITIASPICCQDQAAITATIQTGAYASRVPVVIGSNADEVKLFQAFGRGSDWRGDAYQAATRFGSDRWKADSVDGVARRLASHPDQQPVFADHFRWDALRDDGSSVLPGNWGRRLGAFHSLEIPFFLGTDTVNGVMGWFFFSRRNEPGRRALSAAMMASIAHFIRTGDPNGPGA